VSPIDVADAVVQAVENTTHRRWDKGGLMRYALTKNVWFTPEPRDWLIIQWIVGTRRVTMQQQGSSKFLVTMPALFGANNADDLPAKRFQAHSINEAIDGAAVILIAAAENQ